MDIRIKTEITSEPITAQDVRTFINYDDDDAGEIMLIDDMIKAVRTYLERKCSLSFASRVYEIYFKPDESPFILPIYPIISVDTVQTIDLEGTPTALTLNSGYFKKGTYEVEILPVLGAGSNPFHEGSSGLGLKVTATAGYGHADTQILPLDIVGAMKSQVFQWYDNRDDFYEGNMIGKVDKIIANYRRIW
jgi:uncharacterized phiE125 gp8 family phage protein